MWEGEALLVTECKCMQQGSSVLVDLIFEIGSNRKNVQPELG